MKANQSQLIKLWPLRPHQTTRMNLQKTKKSGKIETKWWYSKSLETYLHVLLSNCLVSGCCNFSRLRNLLPNFFMSSNLLSPYTCSKSLSSMPLLQTILSCVPLSRRSSYTCFCSFPFLLIFVSASQTQSALENPLSFLLFPFLFSKIRMLPSSHAGSSLSICMQPH